MRGQGTPQGTRQDTRQGTPLSARDRLIVALDLPSVEAAQAMVARLGDAVSFYKIGYQLAFAGGLAYRADARRRRQARVSRPQAPRHRQHGGAGREERGAARGELSHRARLSANHAGRGRRARSGPAHPRRHRAHVLRRQRPRRPPVTAHRCAALPPAAPRRRARSASTVSSARPKKRRRLRAIAGPDAGAGHAGHPAGGRRSRRSETGDDAGAAIAAGADYLVVGRPILAAAEPAAAAQAIIAEIAQQRVKEA